MVLILDWGFEAALVGVLSDRPAVEAALDGVEVKVEVEAEVAAGDPRFQSMMPLMPYFVSSHSLVFLKWAQSNCCSEYVS